MNCLFTVNIGNVLNETYRESFVAACKRWGCDFVEVTDCSAEHPFASFEKYYRTIQFGKYEYFIYLDPDCLISENCPSPFDLIKPREIIAVPDFQSPRQMNNGWYENAYLNPMALLSDLVPHRIPSHKNVINSGMFIASPWNEIFTRMILYLRSGFIHSELCEQALFNILLSSGKYGQLKLLSIQWNWLVGLHGQTPKSYIQNYSSRFNGYVYSISDALELY